MADETDNPDEDDSGHAVYDVNVEITAVLGNALMPISQILKLGRGAVVELNKTVGESIEIHANNQLVAKGEVVVVDDRLGVQTTQILKMSQVSKAQS